jgi:low molecular weight protein-tyrosine phosphatase
MTDSRADPNQTSMLFVCTANQCRSPFAEAIARRLAGPQPFVIASAGMIKGGYPVPRIGLQVASEVGLDLAAHRSRQADIANLGCWDVILTMTREHIRELIAADPALWPRVFTIKQFRRWLESTVPSRHAKLGAWIDIVAAGRSRYDMVGNNPDDEIEDPLHSPPDAWREMASELDSEIGAIIDRLSVPGPH